MKYMAIVLLLFSTNCFSAEAIKATGVARATIVAPVIVDWQQETDNSTIVWTEIGPTEQVVF